MADKADELRIGRAFVQQRLQPACGTVQIDGAQGGACRTRFGSGRHGGGGHSKDYFTPYSRRGGLRL